MAKADDGPRALVALDSGDPGRPRDPDLARLMNGTAVNGPLGVDVQVPRTAGTPPPLTGSSQQQAIASPKPPQLPVIAIDPSVGAKPPVTPQVVIDHSIRPPGGPPPANWR